MSVTWQPSAWGKRCAGAGDWQVRLDETGVTADVARTLYTGDIRTLPVPAIRRGLFWSSIVLQFGDATVTLQGLPHRAAGEFGRAVLEAARVAGLRDDYDEAALAIRQWAAAFDAAEAAHPGWLTREFCTRWESAKPAPGFAALLAEPALQDRISAQDGPTLDAIG
ncbi:hypothetical protein HER39_18235, partial [Arthrobacter deserti]|nr:hypothetical protein [Arthrobacter deserti]